MDFAGWFEAYLGIAGIPSTRGTMCLASAGYLMARGRDAPTLPSATTFGPSTLKSFKVWTDEVGKDEAANC